MKYLARLVLSIESLIKNPAKWFTQLNLLLKMLVVFTFIPLISSASILSYQGFEQKRLFNDDVAGGGRNQQITKADLEQALEKYQKLQVEEIQLLREEIGQLKQAINLANGSLDLDSDLTPGSDQVLGSEDFKNSESTSNSEESIENLKERLANFSTTMDDPNFKSVYIKTDNKNVTMYAEPSKSSKQITDFEVGIFYPLLSQKNNWQEVDFGNGKSAWVEKQYVINFPIEEK